MASAQEVINKLLKAVEHGEQRVRQVEAEVEKETGALLAKADEYAQRLAAETDKIIEEYRKKLMEEAEREIEAIARSFEERERSELEKLRARIEERREQAVRAALEALVEAMKR